LKIFLGKADQYPQLVALQQPLKRAVLPVIAPPANANSAPCASYSATRSLSIGDFAKRQLRNVAEDVRFQEPLSITGPLAHLPMVA
jgi:hypothetical protein